MKVHWTDHALAQLESIHEHIAQDAPTYATRVVDRITRRSEQVSAFPQSGRRVPEYHADDIREVVESPYRLIYRIKEDQIDVLAVLHGAQEPPDDLP